VSASDYGVKRDKALSNARNFKKVLKLSNNLKSVGSGGVKAPEMLCSENVS